MQNDYLFPQEMDTAIAGIDAAGEGKKLVVIDDRFLFFGDRTAWSGAEVPARTILYGDHPWDDITEIDWTNLPHNLTEASSQMDASSYAMVVNPNPADRLHLREQADKGSRSQGKYYTGTPVEVLSAEGEGA